MDGQPRGGNSDCGIGQTLGAGMQVSHFAFPPSLLFSVRIFAGGEAESQADENGGNGDKGEPAHGREGTPGRGASQMPITTEEILQVVLNQLSLRDEALAKLKKAEERIKELEAKLKEKPE